MLITAGPTHEPIDAVRYIGNRSSGRMGIALTGQAARSGWKVTLLMGPGTAQIPESWNGPADTDISIIRFQTCEDLRGLLRAHAPKADVLVMAAAVADYRPKVDPAFFGGKFRRTSTNLTLELEPTPDLLAEIASTRRSNQLMVGFALEPRAEMIGSAVAKLTRKKIDMVVANPLETMDSDRVEAVVVLKDGSQRATPGTMTKLDFAPWLIEQITTLFHTAASVS